MSKNSKSSSICLGDRVKDTITGFTGIVVCHFLYLNGCTRLAVQSEKLSEKGVPCDVQYFDEPQLTVVRTAAASEGSHVTGGAQVFKMDR